MNTLTKNSRQAFKQLLILCLIIFGFSFQSFSQSGTSNNPINYAQKSNILDPDTLKGDQKLIFDYFVKLTYQQAKDLEPLKIKEGFAQLGITTNENDRFVAAYSFYASSMTNHKKSCEQWASFKDLAPKQ